MPSLPKADLLEFGSLLDVMAKDVFALNVEAGWYTDPHTGLTIDRNVMEMLMLMTTEVAEAAEGWRKDLMDGHLPDLTSFEVEMADTLIRLLDVMGYISSGKFPFYDNASLGNAFAQKMDYNSRRADHKLSNRAAPNGKKC